MLHIVMGDPLEAGCRLPLFHKWRSIEEWQEENKLLALSMADPTEWNQ